MIETILTALVYPLIIFLIHRNFMIEKRLTRIETLLNRDCNEKTQETQEN